MSTNYIIIKQNFFGKEILRYPGILLNRTSTAITIEAYFQREKILIHNVYINPGDRFVEKYFTTRWFNIFEIHDKNNDKIKCWYCNISTPAIITKSSIRYQDLALDLLVYPDGEQIILDEDEYNELELPINFQRNTNFAKDFLQIKFQFLYKNKIHKDNILNKFT